MRVCFVCSGNICRSPTAEVVFTALVQKAGLADEIVVDSAGTGDWHVGDDMDARSRRLLIERGYSSPGDPSHRAKQFIPSDFADRDLVVALDGEHLSRLKQLALVADDPAVAADSIVLLRSYDRTAVASADLDVPDPYYGESDDFADVLAQIERACTGLLAALQGWPRT
ncbi:low molecular weight protein-tyrosine-phosphatase [Jatrophihabitans sp. DSM 45814]